MDQEKVRNELLAFLRPQYPDMQARAEPWGESPFKTTIFFVDPKFAPLYWDCEILYNVAAESCLGIEYWRARRAASPIVRTRAANEQVPPASPKLLSRN